MTEAAALTAMASPRRREILRLVWREERAAGDIHAAMPDVTFGAVSLQLRGLIEAGLVDVRSEGRNRFYRAAARPSDRSAACSNGCGTTRCGS